MIFGNNPCDFMICIVTSLSVTVLRISTGEIKTFYLFYLSGNSTISTTRKCFNYRHSHLNFLCGLITMAASTESVQAFSERFVPALERFETTSLYHPCLRGMGGLQVEMFLRVLLMLGFVSFWPICPSGEQIAKDWC